MQQSDKLLAETFFRETNIGQSILAYLRCVDFDCVEALQKLGKIGPDAVPPLVQILQRGVPPMIAAELPSGNVPLLVRIRTISALGDLGDTRAVVPLTEVLHDSAPVIRAGAARALGQIGGDRALGALLSLLSDPDELVRETSAIALGKLKRTESLPALRDAANGELKPHVRQAMNAAIQSIERRQ
jgi:HEAT repeat protein